jgi:hypothetical protein
MMLPDLLRCAVPFCMGVCGVSVTGVDGRTYPTQFCLRHWLAAMAMTLKGRRKG